MPGTGDEDRGAVLARRESERGGEVQAVGELFPDGEGALAHVALSRFGVACRVHLSLSSPAFGRLPCTPFAGVFIHAAWGPPRSSSSPASTRRRCTSASE